MSLLSHPSVLPVVARSPGRDGKGRRVEHDLPPSHADFVASLSCSFSAHDVDFQDVRRQLGSVKCFLIDSDATESNAA